ncbi:MAG: hypothetical protein HY472_01725 [Candidatus Sungbacteria bacterium]|nr:hypothetical protein [Candidatus Sungbacteria bacterium]
MESYRLPSSSYSQNILQHLAGIVLIATLGIGGVVWLFIWYTSAQDDLVAFRRVREIEAQRMREKELILQGAIISGRVVSIGADEMILSHEAAEGGVMRVRITPETRVFAWSQEDEPQKIEARRSDIQPRALVTIRATEPIGKKTEITSYEIIKLE